MKWQIASVALMCLLLSSMVPAIAATVSSKTEQLVHTHCYQWTQPDVQIMDSSGTWIDVNAYSTIQNANPTLSFPPPPFPPIFCEYNIKVENDGPGWMNGTFFMWWNQTFPFLIGWLEYTGQHNTLQTEICFGWSHYVETTDCLPIMSAGQDPGYPPVTSLKFKVLFPCPSLTIRCRTKESCWYNGLTDTAALVS